MFATFRGKVERIFSEVLTVVLREPRAWKPCTFQVREHFPNFLLVIEICLVILIQTACCERGNSFLQRIMCDFWSILGVSTIMRISINGVVSPKHYHWLTGWKDKKKIKELRSWAHKSERILVHFTLKKLMSASGWWKICFGSWIKPVTSHWASKLKS